jgi:hypothetical protein
VIGQNLRSCFTIGELFPVWLEQLRVRSEHIPAGADALDGAMTIEALPTWYAGVTFRSRLEADWAATLDSLDIHWEYEPETVTLPSGTRYIPDFHLPELGIWLEVKGTGVPRVEKAIEFGESLACRCENECSCEWPGGQLVIIGHPAKSYDPYSDPELEGVSLRILNNVARRHPGHPNWSSSSGRTAWLTRCMRCWRAGWVTGNDCRACHRDLGGANACTPGDAGLQFVSSICQPAPDRSAPPEEAAA